MNSCDAKGLLEGRFAGAKDVAPSAEHEAAHPRRSAGIITTQKLQQNALSSDFRRTTAIERGTVKGGFWLLPGPDNAAEGPNTVGDTFKIRWLY